MFKFLPVWALKLLVRLAAGWPWLGRILNSIAINAIVGSARTRPHPWSTAHDYISWTSLSDRRYSARHLPAAYLTNLPSAEAVKALFERPDGKQVLDRKSTCLFPAFAQYLTDGFIRTRMPNESIGEEPDLRRQNTSNHQIDLCPLYGRTPEQTDALREKSPDPARRGRLKTQIINGEEFAPFLFASETDLGPKEEFEVLDPPLGLDHVKDWERRGKIFAFGGDRANSVPQVALLNTLFIREHNRLAGELAKRSPEWNDTQVFETARIVLIVIFIKLVVEEYINHISPTPFPLRLDAAIAERARWNRPNWITTEFSLLYRWHSLIPDTLTFNGRTHTVGALFFNNEPLLAGGVLGLFRDLSAQKAGRLGAFNTANDLLGIEIATLEQGRLCHLATYGAYREYVSLNPPESFEDISSDQAVIALLKTLYGEPKNVEFYVGLFAEDQTENSPLSPLILAMVALDAFSQALTNPLFSGHVFKESTFTSYGWQEIASTRSLGDIVGRNVAGGLGGARITMTQPGWRYTW